MGMAGMQSVNDILFAIGRRLWRCPARHRFAARGKLSFPGAALLEPRFSVVAVPDNNRRVKCSM